MAKLGIIRFVNTTEEAVGFMVMGGAIGLLEEVGRLRLICSYLEIADEAKKAIPTLESASPIDGYPTLVLFQKERDTLQEPLEKLEAGGFEIVD